MRALIAIGLLALMVIVWRLTDLNDHVQPRELHRELRALSDSLWSVPVVWLGFLVGTLLMVPVNALFVAVGLSFGFAKAVGLSLSGALFSAVFVHFVGRAIDVDALLDRAPGWVRRFKTEGIEQANVLQLSLVRLMPLGPFATLNLVWGAAGVPLQRVVGATVIGLLPGVLVTSLIGEGLGLAIEDLTTGNLALLGAGSMGLIGLILLGRRLLSAKEDRNA